MNLVISDITRKIKMKLLKERSELVDSELKKLLGKEEPDKLYELMRYHIFAGGKRFRPALCLSACEAVGGKVEKAVPIAASLEILHAFSLIHDDIMDRDELRRGRPTVWNKWGEALAINAGDGMFTKIYESALNSDIDPKVLKNVLSILSSHILEMCEGQALDVDFESREELSIEEYIDMSSRKTGAVMEASTKLGAMVGGGSKEEVDALAKFGRKLGLAFQIWDDYIDFSSDKTGKTFGSDIKKGKKTSIVCHAMENANPGQRKKLVGILKTHGEGTTDSMIREAVSILEKTGSIEYAKNYAMDLVEEAKAHLDVFKDSKAKQDLLDLADFVVDREH